MCDDFVSRKPKVLEKIPENMLVLSWAESDAAQIQVGLRLAVGFFSLGFDTKLQFYKGQTK